MVSWFEIEPRNRTGLICKQDSVGGVIPKEYIPAVQNGGRGYPEWCTEGILFWMLKNAA